MDNQKEIEIENKFAPYYDSVYQSLICYNNRWEKNFVDFRKFINDDKNLLICDLGCGTGTFLKMLENENYRNLFGLDLSTKMLNIARTKTRRVQYKQGLIERTGLNDNLFDVVTVFGSLHHLTKRLDIAIQEIKRILKPKGKIFIIEPNADWLFEKNSWIKKIISYILYLPMKIKNKGKIKQWLIDPSNKNFYTEEHRHIKPRIIIGSLQNANFKQIKTETTEIILPFVEGVLFKGSKFDHFIYKMIKKIDILIFKKNVNGLQIKITATLD